MKKLIIPVGILFATGPLYAQTNTENYLQTRTYLEPVTATSSTAKQTQAVDYYDGLGRIKQSVNVKGSPSQKDVVNYAVYDDFGRQAVNYLPIPQKITQNGGLFTDPLTNASDPNIYGSEKFYSEKTLENSPLDRIREKISVGNDWSTKPTKYEYDTNINGEVKRYTATFNYSTFQANITLTGTYAENLLHKNTIIDEDGNKIIEFTNAQGKTLLVRKVLSASANADTYYVYNNYDQLAFIIPPLASEASSINDQIVNNLCYQYKFDERNRLVEKKLPGKGWEQMVYNKSGKIILFRDANLKNGIPGFITSDAWTFTKYDKFGRVAYTGISTDGTNRKDIQSYVDAQAVDFESRGGSLSLSGMTVEYGNTVYPTSISKIVSVNYYDTYPQVKPDPVSSVIGQTLLSDAQGAQFKTKNLLTATFVKNIEDDNWTRNYTYYDLKGRVVATHSVNFLGGFTRVESELDFAGVLKKKITKHKRVTSDSENVIIETFEYDSQNRLLVHKHKVNNNQEEILAQNEYNELSQLKNKKLGNSSQNIDYKYNIQGWLTQVNDPGNLGNNLFGYKVKYHNPAFSTIAPGKYNGNITEVDWKSSNDGVLKRYNYQYDGLNRLLKGEYSEPENSVMQNHYFDEQLTYDLNGNIKTLQRFTNPSSGVIAEKIDDLIYNYEDNNLSNRLSQITLPQNVVNNVSGYNAMGYVYEYDMNGNIIKNIDKRIGKATYNYLNQLNYIDQDGGYVLTQYLYQSNGNKVRKIEEIPFILKYKKITDYLDGFQYETLTEGSPNPNTNAVLKFIHTSEGYYNPEKNSYFYHYKDHLDNIRLTFRHDNVKGNEIVEQKNFYPFGLDHAKFFHNTQQTILPEYAYAYNGKEYQAFTGMYDYGARMYMPELGKWGSVDPQAEKMTSNSPYNYAFNNPIRFIDPDGRSPYDWVELNGKVFWDSRATNPYKTSILYGSNAIYHAPNSFGYPTTDGYVLLSSNRTWVRNGQEFTAHDEAPSGVDYNHASALEAQAKSFNDYSNAMQESYQDTWGDRSNIATSGILMPRDGDLRWGAFEFSLSIEQNLYLPKTYGTFSGSFVMTDSGEKGLFFSAGPGLGSDSDGFSSSFNFNIYQNTNPYDNYIHFSDFAGWQKNNSVSIPVPQLKSNINANWGSGSTYNYFGIGRGKMGIPSASQSATYTWDKAMWRIR
ncbi:DUF6443 domain-containing protein [Chryseobacterium sp. JK1]|uniref:DUF6443 domain-containing protein n=1 Tax=Chryseobacterium sp. JK1 TaxID=874294 RepID=UPI003D698422